LTRALRVGKKKVLSQFQCSGASSGWEALLGGLGFSSGDSRRVVEQTRQNVVQLARAEVLNPICPKRQRGLSAVCQPVAQVGQSVRHDGERGTVIEHRWRDRPAQPIL